MEPETLGPGTPASHGRSPLQWKTMMSLRLLSTHSLNWWATTGVADKTVLSPRLSRDCQHTTAAKGVEDPKAWPLWIKAASFLTVNVCQVFTIPAFSISPLCYPASLAHGPLAVTCASPLAPSLDHSWLSCTTALRNSSLWGLDPFTAHKRSTHLLPALTPSCSEAST